MCSIQTAAAASISSMAVRSLYMQCSQLPSKLSRLAFCIGLEGVPIKAYQTARVALAIELARDVSMARQQCLATILTKTKEAEWWRWPTTALTAPAKIYTQIEIEMQKLHSNFQYARTHKENEGRRISSRMGVNRKKRKIYRKNRMNSSSSSGLFNN